MFLKHKKKASHRLPFNPEHIRKIIRNEDSSMPYLIFQLENYEAYTIYYGSVISLNHDYKYYSTFVNAGN